MCADCFSGIVCEVNKNTQCGDHIHPSVHILVSATKLFVRFFMKVSVGGLYKIGVLLCTNLSVNNKLVQFE